MINYQPSWRPRFSSKAVFVGSVFQNVCTGAGNIQRQCAILYTCSESMEFTDCITGNDEIIRKATNSILRHAEMCIKMVGGHFEQYTVLYKI
jgi:hypothetical protein